MLDQLRQIAIFAKTVDHGSFRGAARSLRLSPSVVSHHVTQLEERLGTALLYRSTRKLSVTPDGERLLAAARDMLDAAEAGLHDVSSQTHLPTGILRLTVPAVLTHSVLVDRMAAFAKQFPGVQLTLDFSDMRRELIGGGFDIAIRMGWLADSTLMSRKLFAVERQLVASPGYLKNRAAPDTPEVLAEWDWLELAPVSHKKAEFTKDRKRIIVPRPSPRVSVNDASALCRLARLGIGLAIVPDFLVEQDVASGKLQHLLPEWSVASVGVYAVWPPNAPKDGLVKRFVDFIAAPDSQLQTKAADK